MGIKSNVKTEILFIIKIYMLVLNWICAYLEKKRLGQWQQNNKKCCVMLKNNQNQKTLFIPHEITRTKTQGKNNTDTRVTALSKIK